ncbi:hypothetical protein ACLKA7_012153 [Drosophila subpalustris]
MSGKLIMKRKRADQRRTQPSDKQEKQPEDLVTEKRHRLELESRSVTPPIQQQSPAISNTDKDASNSILLEALQKIMELQSELDSFEHDLDEREVSVLDVEEEEHLDAEVAENFAPPTRRSDAEALGFAMCARETLLFLQSEGVSTESVLYKTLLGKLVGQSDGLLHA